MDHVLLLFPFEKKYYDKENIKSTFTGHPLLEEVSRNKVDVTQVIKKHKKIWKRMKKTLAGKPDSERLEKAKAEIEELKKKNLKEA